MYKSNLKRMQRRFVRPPVVSRWDVVSWCRRGGAVGFVLAHALWTMHCTTEEQRRRFLLPPPLERLWHPRPHAERLSCQDASLSFGLTCTLDPLFNLLFFFFWFCEARFLFFLLFFGCVLSLGIIQVSKDTTTATPAIVFLKFP